MFRRHHDNDPAAGADTDDDDLRQVDPELRLRTVRTAHSTIAESVNIENRRAERRRKSRKWLFKSGSRRAARRTTPEDDLPRPTEPEPEPLAAADGSSDAPGRRKVYVNLPLPPEEQQSNGDPRVTYVRNKVKTTSASPFQDPDASIGSQ